MPAAVPSSEHEIATPAGARYCKRWTPPAAADVPIVLLHDSLGCVELWREFPERLAAACGREVIAYDRLASGDRIRIPACCRRASCMTKREKASVR